MHLSMSLWRFLWRLRLALTQVPNSCSTGSFPAQNPSPVPSGAGVPARHRTVARPMVLYSTFQPQVPSYPYCTWFQCSIPQNRDSDSSEQRQCISLYQSYLWATYRPPTLRDGGRDLYPAVRPTGPGPPPLGVRIIL